MPISYTPTTRKLFTLGSVPAGVTVPCGVMTTTLSPTRAPSARASSAPSTMPNPSGLIGERARAHMAAEIGDRVLERGVDAADQRAAIDFSRREHRLSEDVRRRGLDPGVRPRGLRE